MTGPRIVVVGNGMAGARLVEELRRRDPRAPLTVFGSEVHAPYNRILLSDVLAGKRTADDIHLVEADWYARHDVRLHAGRSVVRIDRDAKTVTADDGTTEPYDVLVLATGSDARMPEMAGLVRADGSLAPGAFVFRTADDCRSIVAAAQSVRRAVVVGGGLLGLEAARGLVARGLDVTVVHPMGHLMDRQLDSTAGRVLARRLRELGVRTVLRTAAVGVVGDDEVRGVLLDDGTTLDADLLVLACGVVPNVALARDAGLAVDRAIVVDDALRCVNDDAVHAIGECAQHDGEVYGLVLPAWEQAAVVADVVTGADVARRYRGSRVVTRLKAGGVDLATMGDATADEHEDDDEVVQYVDAARGTYRKLVIRNGKLVAAIILGEATTTGTVVQLFDRGDRVPDDRVPLLFGDGLRQQVAETPALMPGSAVVCRCNNVTKSAIQSCRIAGARTVAEVAGATRATTGCGSCHDTVTGILEWLDAADPQPVVATGAAG